MIHIRLLLVYLTMLIGIQVASQNIKGGDITLSNGETMAISCLRSSDESLFDVILKNNEGENSTWIVTDTFGSIIAIPTSPPFDLDNYSVNPILIWHLSYNQISGLLIGVHKDAVVGVYDYSNSILISEKRIFPAVLSVIEGDTLIACSGDGIGDSIVFGASMNNGSFNNYVITDKDDKILFLSNDSIINIDGIGLGQCYVQHITYEQGLKGLVKDSLFTGIEGCFEVSNRISISKTDVNGGVISLKEGRTKITICVGDGIADAFTPTLIDQNGTNQKWIIADSSGVILALVNNGTFNLEGVGPGIALIYHISYESIQNLERNKNIDTLIGCFHLSNAITVNRIEGETEPGLLSTSTNNDFCNGDKIQDVVALSISGNVGEKYTHLIVDQSGVILDTFNTNKYDFEGFTKVDVLFIFGLSYIYGIDRLSIGNNIEQLEGCYALSNSIPVKIENASGGVIAYLNQQSSTIICSGDNLDDNVLVEIKDTCGMLYTWAITDAEGTILSIQNIGMVNLDIGLETDSTFLQLIAYNTIINGLSVDENIKNLSGCFGISNSLLILNSFGAVDGGMLLTTDNLTRCILPNTLDTLFFNTIDVVGDTSLYVLLKANGEIIQTLNTDYLATSALANGVYDLYHVSAQKYSEGIIIGKTLNDIRGCYALSNKITITISRINGGAITSNKDPNIAICIGDNISDTITISKNNVIGQDDYIILTDAMGLIIDVYINKNIEVKNTFPDDFYIWNIAFNNTLIGLKKGLSIYDVTGCYHLSNSIQFKLNRINPFKLSFSNLADTFTYCSAFSDQFVGIVSTGGIGMDTLYVLKDGNNTILDIQDSTNFDITLYDSEIINISAYSGSDSLYILGNEITNNSNCYVQSNVLTIINQKPEGGILVLPDEVDTLSYCLLPINKDTINVQLQNNFGNNQQLILTDLSGKIIDHYSGLEITPSNLNVDSILIYSVSYFNNISIYTDSLISTIDGCYDLSDPKVLIINRLDGGLFYFGSSDSSKISCFGDTTDYDFFESHISVVSSYILTLSDSTIIKIVNEITDLDLNSLDPNSYFIWHVSSLDSLVDTAYLSQNVENLGGCTHLSNKLTFDVQESILEVSSINLDSTSVLCMAMSTSTIYLSGLDTSNLITYFIVVDNVGNIIAIEDSTSFELPAAGSDFVYQIGYSIKPNNLLIGTNIADLSGCYGLSNGIKIESLLYDGGDISIEGSSDVHFCGVGIKIDSLYPFHSTLGFPNGIWIVTDDSDVVIDTFYNLPILIDNNGPAICYLRFVAYLEGLIIPEVDSSYTYIDGCYDESNKIKITKSLIRGGNIKVNGEQELNICSGDQIIDQVNITISGATGPNNAWILSDTMSNIISILATPPNNFNGLPTGSCLLWHIRYNSNDISGLNVGSAIANIQGCFETSNSVRINKLTVNGGILSVQDSLRELTICVDDGIDENIFPKLVNHIGLQSVWMITSPIGEIIALDVQPPFNFEGEEQGQSFIWNVSFIDEVVGLEIGQFLADLQGCVAVSNPIRVRKKVGSDCVVATNDVLIVSDFIINPNPTSGLVFIKNTANREGKITVVNSIGQSLMTIDLTSRKEESVLDLTTYNPGLYHLLIKTTDGIFDFTIIKI